MIPEITVDDLSKKLKSEENFILLDVREPTELEYARLIDKRLETTPMSRLAREGIMTLSDAAQTQDATIYVMCHHGNRSAQVTAWLAQQGWEVTGVDISEEGIRLAREQATKLGVKLQTVLRRADEFEYGRNQWDLVIGMFMHQIFSDNAAKIIDGGRCREVGRAPCRGTIGIVLPKVPFVGDHEIGSIAPLI